MENTKLDPDKNSPLPAITIQNRYAITVAFTLGVLLFFLPFINIRCNNQQVATASGFDLATGTGIHPAKSWTPDDPIEASQETTNRDKTEKSIEASLAAVSDNTQGRNYYLLTALILGIAGVLISIIRFRRQWLFGTLAAWLGVLCFAISLISIIRETHRFKLQIGSRGLYVNFTTWFFLSLLAFVIAGVLCQANWKQSRDVSRE